MPIRQVVFFASVLMLLELLLGSQFASAAGPVHGAKGAGMGTAFAAVADDPSAIAHNPAGLGFQDGNRVYLGATGVTSETRFTALDGSVEKNDFQVFFSPHFYTASDLNSDCLSIGLGIFSPFGIGGRKWSDGGRFRYISTESYIATLAVNPNVVWRPLPSLALSVGGVYLWTLDRMENMMDQSLFGAGDGQMRFDGDGDGLGWNLGLLWKVAGSVQVGAAFRSAVDVELTGEIELEGIAPSLQPFFGGGEFATDATTDIEFPPIATVSVAWQPKPSWTLAAEIEWGGWSTFDRQRIRLQDPIPAVGFGNIEIPLDWDDSWIYKLGTEYRVNPRLALRGGYSYLTAQVPEWTLSPANPDAEQHYFSLGAGYTLNRLTIDAFYMLGLYRAREVANVLSNGTYRTRGHLLGLSLGWYF